MGIANLISIFDPEIVVLGGGLMNAADLLLEPLRAAVPRWAQPVASADTAIALTALADDAGLLGAARLALLAVENQMEKETNVG
jgi:glucokinase